MRTVDGRTLMVLVAAAIRYTESGAADADAVKFIESAIRNVNYAMEDVQFAVQNPSPKPRS